MQKLFFGNKPVINIYIQAIELMFNIAWIILFTLPFIKPVCIPSCLQLEGYFAAGMRTEEI